MHCCPRIFLEKASVQEQNYRTENALHTPEIRNKLGNKLSQGLGGW